MQITLIIIKITTIVVCHYKIASYGVDYYYWAESKYLWSIPHFSNTTLLHLTYFPIFFDQRFTYVRAAIISKSL